MPNYKNSKIYKICSYQTDEIYVGSTTQNLRRRFQDHEKKYKNYIKNGEKKYYLTSSILFSKFDDCRIELLEEYPCESKKELRRKEGDYIKKYNCVNKLIAGRTDKEWRQDNLEKLQKRDHQYYLDNIEHRKKYYQDNKEAINKRVSEKIECSCGRFISKRNKARHLKSKYHR